MKKYLLLPTFILSLFISYQSNAQERTNVQKLQEISQEKSLNWQAKKALILAYSRSQNIPVRQVFPNGRIIEIVDIINGQPIYYVTNNENAVITTGTNQLYSGGSLNLNLDGTGYNKLAIWDGGTVLTSHQEFNNTGSSRVFNVDGGTGSSAHATHVAGTMVAGGVESRAKGMAFNATLDSYNWTNDEAEMANAAANGLEISNHSYGFITGWSGSTWYGDPDISTQEDYKFGFYDYSSRDIDEIAYNAPYYLIVKSAGNDRNDSGDGSYPPDGGSLGYDCIGTKGIAKNILTVGSVLDVSNYTSPSSVVLNTFSSWAPADDGRIKPDIVANGNSLYSSVNSSNSSYSIYSGTSMSTPNTSGTLALLQQHYQNLNNGTPLKSASLKALVINTAKECGIADGPDYQFGWGLLNAESAADIITKDNAMLAEITEDFLTNGQTKTYQIIADGDKPLKVTVVWTDPEYAALPPALDPTTSVLINDLDARITQASNTFYPYKLNINSPSAAATNSTENNVDNVEHIYIVNPMNNVYTLTIDHDGSISDAQYYSIIVNGGNYNVNPDTEVPNTPANLVALNTTANATNLSWTASTDNVGVTGYDIYQDASLIMTVSSTNVQVTGLIASVNYSFYVIAKDAMGNESTASNTVNVATPYGPPIFVSNPLVKENATEDIVYSDDISNDVLVAQGHTLTLSKISGSTWLNISTSGILSGTPASADLGLNNFIVRADDGNGGITDVTLQITVLTLLNYCVSNGDDTDGYYDGIRLVNFNTINNATPIEDNGYSDFTAISTTVSQNSSYNLTVNINTDGNYTNHVFAWIDWNRDGDFVDAGESYDLGTAVNVSNGVSSLSPLAITIPAGATLGTTRMRVSTKYFFDPTSCEIGFDGEVEDYSINISEPLSACSLGSIVVFPYNEGFENTLGEWTQSNSDDIDWKVNTNETPSLNTGPTSASEGTYYIYVDASVDGTGYPNKRAILNSPCFDLSGLTRASLSFDYHMYGDTDMGSIDLEISTDNGASWTSIWAQSGNQGNSWLSVNLDLIAYIGGNLQIRFNRFVGSTWQADIAIDNFTITSNTTPVFASNPIVKSDATEDLAYIENISGDATDVDGDVLTFSKISGPAWLTIASDGTLSGTPSNSDVGLNSFVAEVNDSNGGTDQTTVEIRVINTNDAPIFNNDPIIKTDAIVGSTYISDLISDATDADGDVLSFSKISGAPWLSISVAGDLSGTPTSDDTGLNSFNIEVNDGNGGIDTAVLEITVVSPSFCDSYGLSSNKEWINEVSFNGIANASGNNGGYADFTAITFNFDINSTVNFTLTPDYVRKSTWGYWAIYIDYNNDSDFNDSGELVYTSGRVKNTRTGSFVTSASNSGLFKMRVSMSDKSTPGSCEIFAEGEVEDYMVNIQVLIPQVPVANFSANSTNIVVGESIQFTDNSSNNPLSWSWTFDGGSPSTSVLQDPVVTYNTVGVYNVSLTATNGVGSDILTKTAYIVVSEDTGTSYCEPVSINNSRDHIVSVDFDGVINISGKSSTGFEVFTSPTFNFIEGQTIATTLQPFSSKNRNSWRIWIDFNGDGDFDDANETVLSVDNHKNTLHGSFTISSSVASTRMRVLMKKGGGVASCEDGFNGEVEDYIINISSSSSSVSQFNSENSLNSNSSLMEISIYPVPVKDYLNISLRNWKTGTSIKIIDIQGRIMMQRPIEESTQINVSDFSSGIYFLHIQNKNISKIKKIIVK